MMTNGDRQIMVVSEGNSSGKCRMIKDDDDMRCIHVYLYIYVCQI